MFFLAHRNKYVSFRRKQGTVQPSSISVNNTEKALHIFATHQPSSQDLTGQSNLTAQFVQQLLLSYKWKG